MGKARLVPAKKDDPIFREPAQSYSPAAIHERLARLAREKAAKEATEPPEWATRSYRGFPRKA